MKSAFRTVVGIACVAAAVGIALPPGQIAVVAQDDRPPALSAFVRRMLSLDRNRDGELSADELPAGMASFIRQHDSDGNGRINVAELQAAELRAEESRAVPDARGRSASETGRPGTGAGRGRNRPGRTGGADPADAAQILRFALTFDRDGDGGLNADELRKYAAALAVRRSQARRRFGAVGIPDDPDATPFEAVNVPANTTPPAQGLTRPGVGGFGQQPGKKPNP